MSMKKECKINGERYILMQDFQEDDMLRSKFNALTQCVFGFGFEAWYQAGYWKSKYRPYALMHGDRFVANISVNDLDFLVHGEKKRVIQIGTVMTDPAYRGRGLSRFLMETILAEYEDRTDFQYLFAGDDVLDFYSKFGFEKIEEFQCSKRVERLAERPEAVRMDLQDPAELARLIQLMEKKIPVSKVEMRGNLELNMFYCGFGLQHQIYYLPSMRLAAVAKEKDGNLMIYDVFSEQEFDLDLVIQALMTSDEMTVSLGFTPLDESGYQVVPYKEEDRICMICGGQIGRSMFPVLSQA